MRRAILEISAAFLVDLAKPTPQPWYVRVAADALPSDARAVGGYYDSIRDVFQVAVESETFRNTPDGVALPTLPPPTLQVVLKDATK